jgi:hypothetical protein
MKQAQWTGVHMGVVYFQEVIFEAVTVRRFEKQYTREENI